MKEKHTHDIDEKIQRTASFSPFLPFHHHAFPPSYYLLFLLFFSLQHSHTSSTQWPCYSDRENTTSMYIHVHACICTLSAQSRTSAPWRVLEDEAVIPTVASPSTKKKAWTEQVWTLQLLILRGERRIERAGGKWWEIGERAKVDERRDWSWQKQHLTNTTTTI